VDRTIQELAATLSADSRGAVLARMLLEVVRSRPKRTALEALLIGLAEQGAASGADLTPMEQAIMNMLSESGRNSLTLEDVRLRSGDHGFDSLSRLSHVSKTVNDLAGKGRIGKWSEPTGPGRPAVQFGDPGDAVMKALVRLGMMPDEVGEDQMLEISRMTGLPLDSVAEQLQRRSFG